MPPPLFMHLRRGRQASHAPQRDQPPVNDADDSADAVRYSFSTAAEEHTRAFASDAANDPEEDEQVLDVWQAALDDAAAAAARAASDAGPSSPPLPEQHTTASTDHRHPTTADDIKVEPVALQDAEPRTARHDDDISPAHTRPSRVTGLDPELQKLAMSDENRKPDLANVTPQPSRDQRPEHEVIQSLSGLPDIPDVDDDPSMSEPETQPRPAATTTASPYPSVVSDMRGDRPKRTVSLSDATPAPQKMGTPPPSPLAGVTSTPAVPDLNIPEPALRDLETDSRSTNVGEHDSTSADEGAADASAAVTDTLGVASGDPPKQPELFRSDSAASEDRSRPADMPRRRASQSSDRQPVPSNSMDGVDVIDISNTSPEHVHGEARGAGMPVFMEGSMFGQGPSVVLLPEELPAMYAAAGVADVVIMQDDTEEGDTDASGRDSAFREGFFPHSGTEDDMMCPDEDLLYTRGSGSRGRRRTRRSPDPVFPIHTMELDPETEEAAERELEERLEHGTFDSTYRRSETPEAEAEPMAAESSDGFPAPPTYPDPNGRGLGVPAPSDAGVGEPATSAEGYPLRQSDTVCAVHAFAENEPAPMAAGQSTDTFDGAAGYAGGNRSGSVQDGDQSGTMDTETEQAIETVDAADPQATQLPTAEEPHEEQPREATDENEGESMENSGGSIPFGAAKGVFETEPTPDESDGPPLRRTMTLAKDGTAPVPFAEARDTFEHADGSTEKPRDVSVDADADATASRAAPETILGLGSAGSAEASSQPEEDTSDPANAALDRDVHGTHADTTSPPAQNEVDEVVSEASIRSQLSGRSAEAEPRSGETVYHDANESFDRASEPLQVASPSESQEQAESGDCMFDLDHPQNYDQDELENTVHAVKPEPGAEDLAETSQGAQEGSESTTPSDADEMADDTRDSALVKDEDLATAATDEETKPTQPDSSVLTEGASEETSEPAPAALVEDADMPPVETPAAPARDAEMTPVEEAMSAEARSVAAVVVVDAEGDDGASQAAKVEGRTSDEEGEDAGADAPAVTADVEESPAGGEAAVDSGPLNSNEETAATEPADDAASAENADGDVDTDPHPVEGLTGDDQIPASDADDATKDAIDPPQDMLTPDSENEVPTAGAGEDEAQEEAIDRPDRVAQSEEDDGAGLPETDDKADEPRGEDGEDLAPAEGKALSDGEAEQGDFEDPPAGDASLVQDDGTGLTEGPSGAGYDGVEVVEVSELDLAMFERAGDMAQSDLNKDIDTAETMGPDADAPGALVATGGPAGVDEETPEPKEASHEPNDTLPTDVVDRRTEEPTEGQDSEDPPRPSEAQGRARDFEIEYESNAPEDIILEDGAIGETPHDEVSGTDLEDSTAAKDDEEATVAGRGIMLGHETGAEADPGEASPTILAEEPDAESADAGARAREGSDVGESVNAVEETDAAVAHERIKMSAGELYLAAKKEDEIATLKRRLHQHADSLHMVTLRAREQISTAIQNRNDALAVGVELREENERLLEKNEELKAKLSTLETENENLESKVKVTNASLDHVVNEMNFHRQDADKQRRIAQRHANTVDTNLKLRASLNAQLQTAKKERDDAVREREEIAMELVELKTRFEVLQKEAEVTRSAKNTTEEECRSLRLEARARTVAEAQCSTIAQRERALATMLGEFSALTSRYVSSLPVYTQAGVAPPASDLDTHEPLHADALPLGEDAQAATAPEVSAVEADAPALPTAEASAA